MNDVSPIRDESAEAPDSSFGRFRDTLAKSTERLAKAVEDNGKKARTRLSWGPLYTMVFWPVVEDFELKLTDYLLADAIHKLSGNHAPITGWCNASKETLADLTRTSRTSAFRGLKTLREKGLIEENPERSDLLRSTPTWERAIELCKRRLNN